MSHCGRRVAAEATNSQRVLFHFWPTPRNISKPCVARLLQTVFALCPKSPPHRDSFSESVLQWAELSGAGSPLRCSWSHIQWAHPRLAGAIVARSPAQFNSLHPIWGTLLHSMSAYGFGKHPSDMEPDTHSLGFQTKTPAVKSPGFCSTNGGVLGYGRMPAKVFRYAPTTSPFEQGQIINL